jgi:hypothetical protein
VDRGRERGGGPGRGALTIAVLAAALGASCTGRKGGDEPAGLGTRVHDGAVRALEASPDGAWLALLDGCSEVRGGSLPPGTASCDLRVVPAAGGASRRVAGAVTTLPHGFAWAPRGDLLAAVAEYDYVNGAGTLVVLSGAGEPLRVADGVTFHGFVPGEPRVAAIAGGRLVEAAPGAAPEWTAGADGLSSFELGPAAAGKGAVAALLRRSARTDGALLAVAAGDGPPAQVAQRTGDYAIAPGGAAFAFTVQGTDGYELRLAAGGAPVRIGRQVQSFAFSRDGSAIAFVGDAEPGRQGNLHVRAVGGPDAILGREVGEFRWASRAPRLAWLERYDPRVRSGALGVGGPGLAPRTFGRNVSDLEISPDGAHVAFLEHTTRGGYSVDLALARVEAPKGEAPRAVAAGVFGFSFSPDGRWLYYRTRCTRNGEACDLERVAVEGAAGAKPEAIAQGVKSFEFDPRDPERLLVTWQRADLVALDIAIWERGKLTMIDRGVLAGTAQLLGPDSRRVAYAVVAPKRQGVYVAEVPSSR